MSTAVNPPRRSTLVARSWIGRVPAEKAEAYHAYVEATGIPGLRGTPGNLSAEILRRTVGGVTEFLVLSTWDSIESVRAFAGDQIDRARYYPEDEEFLLEMPETVEHWELFPDPRRT